MRVPFLGVAASLLILVIGCATQAPTVDVLGVEREHPESEGVQDSGRVPAKALIRGVPFISFREAAQLEYENKATTHPSFPAAEAMSLKYWGQDPSLINDKAALERWGLVQAGSGKSLDDLKAYVARGIPVMVAPAITAVADAPNPLVVALAAMGVKRTSGPLGPSVSAATMARVQDLMAERSDRRAGVLGKMEPLEVFHQLEEATGMSPWETTRGSARLVIGYDDGRRVIILHDPSFGPAWEVGYDDFEKMWAATRRWYATAHPHDHAHVLAKRSAASAYPPRGADQLAAAHYVLGYALASVGRADEAEEEFRRGLATPGISRGYRHLFLLELAQLYRARGNTQDAITAAEQAAALVPEHHRPWELLAQTYRSAHAEGWEQKAEAAQKKADAVCGDQDATQAVARALARDFNVYGCAPGRLLIADR